MTPLTKSFKVRQDYSMLETLGSGVPSKGVLVGRGSATVGHAHFMKTIERYT